MPLNTTFLSSSRSRTLLVLLVLCFMCQFTAAKSCNVTSQCTNANWAEVCESKKCVHKKTFPVLPSEIGGIVAVIFFKALCTMAGVGGSAIIHPICIVLFGFVTKSAIPIATFATMIATLASFIANINAKHPEKKQTVLYDYGVISVMMPTTLAGAQIGSFLLVVMPSVIIQICLVIMLIGLMIQSGRKAAQICRKENKLIALKKEGDKQQ